MFVIARLRKEPKQSPTSVLNIQRTAAMQSFLYMEGKSMGLKSQLLGSIMPARKRFVAMLALSICPLVRTRLRLLLSTPSSGCSDAAPATPGIDVYIDRTILLCYFIRDLLEPFVSLSSTK